MVHFGNQLKHHRIPEWASNYLNYEKLKRIINLILNYRAARVETNKNIDLLELDKRKLSAIPITLRESNDQSNINKIEVNDTNKTNYDHLKNKNTDNSDCVENSNEILNIIDPYDNSQISELQTNQNSNTEEFDLLETHLTEERKIMEMFADELKQNINTIESFYIQINSDLVAKLKKLNDNYHLMNDQHSESKKRENDMILDNHQAHNEDEHILNQSDFLKIEKHKKFRESQLEINKRKEKNDEAGFSTSWKRAYGEVYNKSSWLHGFCVINKIAMNKIIKKFLKTFCKKLPYDNENKQVSKFIKEVKILHEELQSIVSKCKFFNETDEVVNLRVDVIQSYAENFFGGNNDHAKESLELRLKGGLPDELKLISFYIGMLLSMILFSFALSFIPVVKRDNDLISTLSTWVFFPAFNFTFMIGLLFYGLAFNLHMFHEFRVNYIYIFEIDPIYRLTPFKFLRLALLLTNLWFFLFLMYYFSLEFYFFERLYWLFPLFSLILIIVVTLYPFHLFYYYFRKGVMATFIKNLFPIGANGVRFKDFILGDIMTSLVKPFTSLSIAICLLSNQDCINNNIRDSCSRNDVIALVLTLAPYTIRFLQCLNRWYYTKLTWPHAFNALKYIGGFTNAYFGWLYANNIISAYLYVSFGIVAVTYMLFWDFYMDWGLFREFTNKDNKFLLRSKTMYPNKYYYIAMSINILLRYIWLLSFYSLYLSDSIKESEIKALFFSLVEVLRRIQWTIFRVEHENVNNPEKYRTVLEMPLLPREFITKASSNKGELSRSDSIVFSK